MNANQYPIYVQDQNGQVQIKIISPEHYAVVGNIKYSQGFEKCFMAKVPMNHYTQSFLKLPESNQQQYEDAVALYIEHARSLEALI